MGWYFCLVDLGVEPEDGCANAERLGPYESEHAARQALERLPLAEVERAGQPVLKFVKRLAGGRSRLPLRALRFLVCIVHQYIYMSTSTYLHVYIPTDLHNYRFIYPNTYTTTCLHT